MIGIIGVIVLCFAVSAITNEIMGVKYGESCRKLQIIAGAIKDKKH